jgi:hypothetical protein
LSWWTSRGSALPGYSGFLRAPNFDDLCAAARPGPVVIINVSQYRCDALIVTADRVQVVPLTGLTGTNVVRHATNFLVALESPHRKELSYPELKAAHDTITATLRWLWEAIALPVLPACSPPARQALLSARGSGGAPPGR